MAITESSRRKALRVYLLEVTRDSIAHGLIRHAAGQSLSQVMESEIGVVIGEVHADLLEVGKDMGFGLANGLLQAGMNWLGISRR